ncbi:unnamed protein product [Pseudo-nitzschia multistriata]|uniref:Uncharacterized protein n=1 Tax=Pseudo-nitzschia multistriata TaxID=183589 RepID=A0A448YUL6_9STRA|nr:unnamed protein product [Pseudo-nitzschia multistriata]
MNTTEDTKTDVINSNGSASTNGKTGGESGPVENAKVKNKEAILTGGMGYGRKKRQALDAFWSILWPGLEKIGWKRIVGEGSDEGSMIFLPPGIIAMRRGKRNIEYFDRIKLVIEFLEERRSKAEGKILDLYRKEIPATGGDAVASNPKRVGGRPRLRVSRS